MEAIILSIVSVLLYFTVGYQDGGLNYENTTPENPSVHMDTNCTPLDKIERQIFENLRDANALIDFSGSVANEKNL
jgi:hypothetical protein